MRKVCRTRKVRLANRSCNQSKFFILPGLVCRNENLSLNCSLARGARHIVNTQILFGYVLYLLYYSR